MRNKAGILIGLAIAGGLAWTLWPAPAPRTNHGDLDDVFFNRFWIDRLPERLTDKVDILVLSDPQVGAFQRTSAFEGDYAMFEWKTSGAGKLKIVMLQTQKRHEIRYEVRNRGCGEFDYCAKVKGAPRGASRYVSMEDWVLSPGQPVDPDALRARVYRQLRGAGER